MKNRQKEKVQYSYTLSGGIGEGTMLFLPKEEEIEKQSIYELVINSSGGDGQAAIGMFDLLMERSKKQEIRTIGVGRVESSAMWPFVCGHERWSYPNTMFMFHAAEMKTGVSDLEIEQLRKLFDSIINTFLNRLTEISNQPRSFWRNLCNGHRVWFTAKEMKEIGVVTKIV